MFFKFENGTLMFGHCVEGNGFSLCEAALPDLTLPIEGWHWFGTETEARTFFGIVAPDTNN